MRTCVSVYLLLQLLILAACGTRLPTDWIPAECVDRPMYRSRCAPTPNASEQSAVHALDLPANIEFDLQRAIYRWEQMGVPDRVAEVYIHFGPNTLSITEAVTLAEQHGVVVHEQYERYSVLEGVVPLNMVPLLAAERGILGIELVELYYIPESVPACPTPGGPTAVPITCEPVSP